MENGLQTRWTSVGKLQRRIFDLEAELRKRREFFSSLFQSINGGESPPCNLNKHLTSKAFEETCSLHYITKFTGHFSPIAGFGTHPKIPLLLVNYNDCSSRMFSLLEGMSRAENITTDGIALMGHSAPVSCFASSASSNGNLLLATGSSDTTIRIYSVELGKKCKCIRTFFTHKGTISFLAFCLSDRLLSYSKQEGAIRLHSISTGQEITMLSECPAFACFAPEPVPEGNPSAFLGVTNENAFYAIRINTLIELQQVHVESVPEAWSENLQHKSPIAQCLWFSPTLFMTGSIDKTIKIWRICAPKYATGNLQWTAECINTLQGHSGRITGLHKVMDSLLISTSDDQQILLWDLTNLEQVTRSNLKLSTNGPKTIFISAWNQFVLVARNDSSVEMHSIY